MVTGETPLARSDLELQTIIGRVARALRGYFHEPTTNDSEHTKPLLMVDFRQEKLTARANAKFLMRQR